MTRSSADEQLRVLLKGEIDPSVKKSFEKVESYSKKLQGRVEELSKTQSKGKAWQILAKDVKNTEKSYNSLIQRYDKLNKSISKNGKATKEQKIQLRELNREIKSSKTNLDYQTNTFSRLSRELKEAGFNTDRFAASQRRLQRSINFKTGVHGAIQYGSQSYGKYQSNASRNRDIRSNATSSAWSTAFMAMAGAAPVIQGALTAHEFQKVRAVTKFMEDKSPEEYKSAYDALFSEARGVNTHYDQKEVYKAIQQLGKGGANPVQAKESLIHVLNTAASSLETTTPEEASDIITDIAGGFEIEKNSAGIKRIANTIVGTTSTSSTNIQDVYETLKYVGNISSFVEDKDRGLEMISSYIGLLASKGGIKGSTPGTALRQIYSQLLERPEQVRTWQKTLGVEFKQDGKFKSLDKIFKDLALSFKKNHYSKDQMGKALFQLFDKRAAPAAIKMTQLALNKKEGFDFYFNKMMAMSKGNVAGDTAVEAYEDLVGDAYRLRKSVSIFSEDFTKLFDKDLRGTLKGWNSNIQSFNKYVQENPETIRAVGSTLKNLLLLKGGMIAGKFGYSLISDMVGVGMFGGRIAGKGIGYAGKGIAKTAMWSANTMKDVLPSLLPWLIPFGGGKGKGGMGKMLSKIPILKHLANPKMLKNLGRFGSILGKGFKIGKLATAFTLPGLIGFAAWELLENWETVTKKLEGLWDKIKEIFEDGSKAVANFLQDPTGVMKEWGNSIEGSLEDKNKYGWFTDEDTIQKIKNRDEEHFSQIHSSNYVNHPSNIVNNFNINSSEPKAVSKEIVNLFKDDLQDGSSFLMRPLSNVQ